MSFASRPVAAPDRRTLMHVPEKFHVDRCKLYGVGTIAEEHVMKVLPLPLS
jgi:hypothetical protein